MRLILHLFLVLVASMSYGFGEHEKEEHNMSPLEFIRNYEKAISTQSWENVEQLIHPDCVVTFTNGTYKGKSEVEEVFRKNFELIKEETYSITNIHFVAEKADHAVFIFHYKWSGIVDGKPAEGGGRGTSVIVKYNGSWQLISEHLGPNA